MTTSFGLRRRGYTLGMSTPADDVDKTENDVRRTEEVIQQGTDQDQELPTETKPAGPLPDFNT